MDKQPDNRNHRQEGRLMKEPIILFGCGGHARSVLDILHTNKVKNKIILVDKNAKENEQIMGHDVLKYYTPQNTSKLFPATGTNKNREKLLLHFGEKNFISIISCTAHISENVSTKAGTLVSHRAFLGTGVQTGLCCIINTGTIIEHEVEIGNYVHIAPGCIICGRSRIGNHVLLGAGSTVIDNITICDHVTTGAGSIIIQDITVPGTYAGVPARKIR